MFKPIRTNLLIAMLVLEGCSGTNVSHIVPTGLSIQAGLRQLPPTQRIFLTEANRANHGWGDVLVFDYPSGKYDGPLAAPPEGFQSPGGACTDRRGHIYVLNYGPSKIDVYSGQGAFIRSVSNAPLAPTACAIAPTTGDLAVADTDFEGDEGVSTFRNAQGKPKRISSPYFANVNYVSYDASGNLFLDGSQYLGSSQEYGEIRKDTSTIQKIALDKQIPPYQLQFDGKYVAIGSDHYTVYRASGAHVVSSTVLSGGVTPFFVSGDRLLTLNGPEKGHYTIHVYRYPQGGHPVSTILLQHYFSEATAGDIVLSR